MIIKKNKKMKMIIKYKIIDISIYEIYVPVFIILSHFFILQITA